MGNIGVNPKMETMQLDQNQKMIDRTGQKNPGGIDSKIFDDLVGVKNNSITDNRITGDDGDQLNFIGANPGQSYNLYSERGFEMKGMIDANPNANDLANGSQDLGKTAISVADPNNNGNYNTIEYDKNGKAMIDGEAMQEGKVYNLKDGGVAMCQDDTLIVQTGDGHQITQHADAESDCVNVEMDNSGVIPNFIDIGFPAPPQPGGILGQTKDADNQVHTNASMNLQDHATDSLQPGFTGPGGSKLAEITEPGDFISGLPADIAGPIPAKPNNPPAEANNPYNVSDQESD